VRTIGSEGSGAEQPLQLRFSKGVAVDGDGRIVVCDTGNSRLQVLP
jgi:sugar lactone lactonase YvrE